MPKHNINLGKFTLKSSFDSTGRIGMDKNAVREEIFLNVFIRDVNAGNVIRIEGRVSNDDTWQTVQDLTGAFESQLVNIAAYDFVRFSCQTLDVASEGLIFCTSYTDLKLPALYATNGDGDWALNVIGETRPRGLSKEGLMTSVPLVDTGWTALPATAQTDRNAIGIQNNTGFDIYLNFVNTATGLGDSIIVRDGDFKTYDITDEIILYGRMSTGGSGSVIVEELA